MNLKLFSLISSDDIPATKLQIKISGSLNTFTDDDVSFKRFSSLKEMFPSLGKALADSELIVIAVDPKIYVRTKTLLTKALSLDIEENPTVKKALGRAAEIPESQKLLQSQMPKGAVPFLTRDGVNSGFVTYLHFLVGYGGKRRRARHDPITSLQCHMGIELPFLKTCLLAFGKAVYETGPKNRTLDVRFGNFSVHHGQHGESGRFRLE